jgi:hypothetical protein
MNLTKSHRREIIVRIQSMMVNIMPYQVWKYDALEISPLKAMGTNFCGVHARALLKAISEVESAPAGLMGPSVTSQVA